MARLWSSGWENVASDFTSTSGSPQTSSIATNSGSLAGRTSSLSSGVTKNWSKQATTGGQTLNGPIYFRFYFLVATLPSAANTFFSNGGGIAVAGCLKITSTGTLQLFNNTTQVGSDSSALNLNQWYRIEMLQDKSGAGGSHTLTALIDGTSFASATNLTLADAYHDVQFGGNLKSEAQTVGGWYFDDAAVNDNTAGGENTYPGPVRDQKPGNIGKYAQVGGGMSRSEVAN